MPRRFVHALAATFLATSLSAHDGHEHATLLTQRAKAFADAYSHRPGMPAQQLVFEFEDASRTNFDFFPRPAREHRAGVTIAALSIEHKRALHALLQASLSDAGYLRVQAIRSLEDVLRQKATEPSGMRMTDDYSLQLYGLPTPEATWGMKFEGHHVSLNVTVRGNDLRPTPLFLGANPAEVRTGPMAGLRVLASQEDLGRALFASCDDAQRQVVLLREQHGKEWIRRGPLTAVPEPVGLPATTMNDAQRAILRNLVASYLDTLHPAIAKRELDRFDATGMRHLHFAWEGSNDPRQPCAYRVQGPTVFLEFETIVDDPAQGANHVHAQWRDPQRDFGMDLLHAHREAKHGDGDH